MLRIWCFIICFYTCSAAINDLNDTEYQRMPPLFSLDDYESCLSEEYSVYCVLQLHLHAEPGNQLMHMITEYSKYTFTHYNHTIIDRGVCVRKASRSSRTEKELSGHLEARLNESLHSEYGVNARLSTLHYCDHHKERSQFDVWDWTVLATILAFVIMNIVGSVYDITTSKGSNSTTPNGNSVLLSFSIIRNWKRLMDTDVKNPNSRDLQFIHGVRVIFNLCIVLLHSSMVFTVGFTTNTQDIEKAFEVPKYYLLFNATMIVQIFFFISGFLAAYHLRIEEERRTFKAWDVPKIMLLRFTRLIPALVMTLALTSTWLRRAGSGPLWRLYVTGSLVADCRTNWWRHLLFFNNYSHHNSVCLHPTWHLAADVQVYLACVSAYIFTRGRARLAALGTLLLLGVAAPALHTFLQDLNDIAIMPQSFRTIDNRIFWLQQALGHNNLSCFVIGMATAVLIYNWRNKGGHLRNNRWYSLLQYISAAAIPLVMYAGRMFYSEDVRNSVAARVAYNSTVRAVLGLACALTVPAFFITTPTFVKSFCEWRLWAVPSRLTYCVFLLHMPIVYIVMGARTQLSYFSFANVVSVFSLVTVVTFLISVPFFLLVEEPITTLFKTLFKRPTDSRTSLKNEAHNAAGKKIL